MDYQKSLTLFADADLTVDERDDLIEHEEIIEQGLQTFVDVGTALLAIRDGKLYRETHATFEEYCRGRWEMVASRARQLIAAAETVENLKTVTTVTLPESERQARPLSKLEPEQQREAWAKAVDTAPNGKVTAAHVQRVVDEYDEQSEESSEEADGYEWSEEIAQPSKLAVHFSSDTPEHYTPAEILDAVVACMGAIDLDPCSNSKTEPNVPADFHYTQEDDGLAQVWQGRVFLNPPYGREIGKWVAKLREEFDCGNVTEAIALVPARTDTDWFDRLIDGYQFHCFVHGRLTFIGNGESAPFPSTIVYLGTDWGRFYYAFRSFGRIVQETHPEMFGE